jgi:hypothetical protein
MQNRRRAEFRERRGLESKKKKDKKLFLFGAIDYSPSRFSMIFSSALALSQKNCFEVDKHCSHPFTLCTLKKRAQFNQQTQNSTWKVSVFFLSL